MLDALIPVPNGTGGDCRAASARQQQQSPGGQALAASVSGACRGRLRIVRWAPLKYRRAASERADTRSLRRPPRAIAGESWRRGGYKSDPLATWSTSHHARSPPDARAACKRAGCGSRAEPSPPACVPRGRGARGYAGAVAMILLLAVPRQADGHATEWALPWAQNSVADDHGAHHERARRCDVCPRVRQEHVKAA